MTAFHTIAVPHEDILAGRQRVREKVSGTGQQQGRIISRLSGGRQALR